MHAWWCMSDSVRVLGHLKECMQSFAQHCLLSVQAPYNTTLQVLSLSDGYMNDWEVVPTSVLLAHAFASLDIYSLPAGLERITIYGADVDNPPLLWNQTQSWMPPWLELHHIRLDNKQHLIPQLFKFGLYQQSAKFDVVLMRNGLCYCWDHSFKVSPPEKVKMIGIKGEDGSDEPSGTYILEPDFCDGRPCYRKGELVLRWRAQDHDWAIVEDETGYVWANVCKDTGSPALAQAPWCVWDGEDWTCNECVSCDVEGSCPWRRPPDACKCCAGISLDAAAMQGFIKRVATVLNEHNPRAFALLHGGFYKGLASEVEEFHLELERAVEQFNSSKSCMCASVLRRQEPECKDTGCCAQCPTTNYWNEVDGLLLSARLHESCTHLMHF